MKAATHVGDTGSDPDPRSCAELDHLRKLSSTVRSTTASALPSTLIKARPGSSM
jgi:hypothetical protein